MILILFTINNLSNYPIRYFDSEEKRDLAFQNLEPTYKKRFGKGKQKINIEDRLR